jgi:hypothetical protein
MADMVGSWDNKTSRPWQMGEVAEYMIKIDLYNRRIREEWKATRASL